jgi:hypothetical protein
VHVFEEVFDKPFAVAEVPESALEEQWKSAGDPFTKSFTALMLGAARGKTPGRELSRDFPVKLTRVRDFVERLKER